MRIADLPDDKRRMCKALWYMQEIDALQSYQLDHQQRYGFFPTASARRVELAVRCLYREALELNVMWC
jgi:hypothetical protein